MGTTIFLQSAVKDPYQLYEDKLWEGPVHWDPVDRCWGIYSYACCKMLLKHPSALIPVLNPGNKDGLNEYALLISEHLTRLSNPPYHEIARQTALYLFEKMKLPVIDDLLKILIQRSGDAGEIDWVDKGHDDYRSYCYRKILVSIPGTAILLKKTYPPF